MAQELYDFPRKLGLKFGAFGNGPFIVDDDTKKRLSPQQIVDAYNTLVDMAQTLIERIESDVD